MASVSFNGTDLATLGCAFPSQTGLPALAALDQERTFIPGRAWWDVYTRGMRERSVRLEGVCVGSSHADLITKLSSLADLLRPSGADPDAYFPLTRPDRSGVRLMVQCVAGFDAELQELPFLTRVAPITLELVCQQPYWEDASIQQVVIDSDTTSIENDGKAPCSAHFDITFAGALNSFWFEILNERFVFNLPVTPSTVIQVRTDTLQVFVNGSESYAGTQGSRYPMLGVGTNPVTLSSPSVNLEATFRRLWR